MAALPFVAPVSAPNASCLADIEQVRRENPLPAIAGAILKLRRSGNEWTACCPFHNDRSPSFTIYDGGKRFKCFGCGETGDVLDFVQAVHKVDFVGALQLLGAGNLPKVALAPSSTSIERDSKDDRTPEALAIWDAAQPATGTPAEAYLRSRGITMPVPPTIRFTRLQYGKFGPQYPVLVALVQNVACEPIGIQRTYLDPGGNGKAAVAKPKLSLGSIRGGAVRLGEAANQLIVCEGLEDGLTIQQQIGAAVWVGVGTSGLSGMQFPACVASVVIGADADEPGEKAAAEAGKRFASAGLGVRVIWPTRPFKDFNAELLGGAA